jgi:hypothetical protein
MRLRLRLDRPDASAGPALEGFVDALLQKFENCRAGLGDEVIAAGDAEAFFVALYEPEREGLAEIIRRQQPQLDEAGAQTMIAQVEELLRTVAIPGYLRLAIPFTQRERNGFYLVRDPLHGAERAGWAVAGTLLGAFVVWAPFIPLWSKEWVLPFFLGGLVFPELRRWWELRRYEAELNRLVARSDAEIGRVEMTYLMRDPAAEQKRPRRALARGAGAGGQGAGGQGGGGQGEKA